MASVAQFQVLNKILQNKDMSLVINNNLTADFFITYRAEFNFIKNHYDTYHTVPDRLTFLQNFPDFEIQDVSEPDSYLMEQLSEDYNYNYMAAVFNKVKGNLENDNVESALQLFTKSVDGLRRVASMTSVNITRDTSRYDRYIDRCNNFGKDYISTGFKELDAIIGGIDMHNENMVIAARTGVGKSWLAIAMATAACQQGKKVGFYSGEMSVDKVSYRFDTLMGHINNNHITRGNGQAKSDYKRYLESLSNRGLGDFIVITPEMLGGPATVSALRAFCERDGIEILFIDQYSLLEDESGAKVMHEKVANISKAVKNLQVLKQLPIVSVAQMNRTKNTDADGKNTKEQDSTQIGLSDRIPQDATVLLMLDKEPFDSESDNFSTYKVTVNIVKSRDGGDNRKLNYRWDFNTGNISFIPNNKGSEMSEEEIQAVADEYGDEYGGAF